MAPSHLHVFLLWPFMTLRAVIDGAGLVGLAGLSAGTDRNPARLHRLGTISLGFDPISFGVIIVMTVELDLIHPPVGMNIYVRNSVIEDVKISTIFYGVLPFIVTDILGLSILIVFPALPSTYQVNEVS